MSNFGFEKNSDAATGCLAMLLVIFLCSLLFALPVMWLWNWLVTDIFSLRAITWIEAWGLNLLTSLLFTSRSTNSK